MKVFSEKYTCKTSNNRDQLLILAILVCATLVYLIHIECFLGRLIAHQQNLFNYIGTHNTSTIKNVTEKSNAGKQNTPKSLDFSHLARPRGQSVHCTLPVLNPFDKFIVKFVKKLAPENCQTRYPMLFETDLESNLIVLNSTQTEFTDCCYGQILRPKGKDNQIILSEQCIPIKQNKTKVAPQTEFVYVSCLNNSARKNRTLVDMFGFVNLKSKVESSLDNIKDDGSEEKLNVIILGLDSISHMNFIRTNKKSHKYLTQNLTAVEFNGYTKIADNTFPNMVPILMGLTEKEVKKKCFSKSGYFDSCPFIWKEFSRRGYRTSYSEDSPKISIFNYASKKGFVEPPTDYYLRPLMFAQNSHIANGILTYENVCHGPRYSFEVLLDNIRKTAWSLGAKGKPYFQFVWSTALSHDWANAPSWGDKPFSNTLEWLSSTNGFNDTILILLSDHGARWGDIRDSFQGWIEERMPLFYSVFPKWFEEKYKTAMVNFRRNVDKLTTPFDVHETLKDILNLKNIEENSIKSRTQKILKVFNNNFTESRMKTVRGISLFLPIPPYRDCGMAQIPQHFCVCDEIRPVSIINNNAIKDISHLMVKQINVLLRNYSQCFQIKLTKIVTALTVVKRSPEINPPGKDFIVNISTEPGDARFEATVRVVSGQLKQNNYSLDVNTITRTNRYGWHSYCVKDPHLKKFCFCR